MRGDTRGEMRENKDIKREKYMRIEENKAEGRQRGGERVCGLWLIPVLVIWHLHGS